MHNYFYIVLDLIAKNCQLSKFCCAELKGTKFTLPCRTFGSNSDVMEMIAESSILIKESYLFLCADIFGFIIKYASNLKASIMSLADLIVDFFIDYQ